MIASYNAQPRDSSGKPLVSVFIMTYNQEDYILQTIESVLGQKCSFSFEVVIGDDASTDRTSEICSLYCQAHAQIVKYKRYSINSPTNYWDRYTDCQGKYIAMCEGDDYWISEDKLERQIAVLEQRIELALVSANTMIINESENSCYSSNIQAGHLGLGDLLRNNRLGPATCATVFRKKCLNARALEFISSCTYGDWAVWLVCLSQGEGLVLEERLGAYRIHSNGFYSGLKPIERAQNILAMYREVAAYWPHLTSEMEALMSEFKHPLSESDLDQWGYPLPHEMTQETLENPAHPGDTGSVIAGQDLGDGR